MYHEVKVYTGMESLILENFTRCEFHYDVRYLVCDTSEIKVTPVKSG